MKPRVVILTDESGWHGAKLAAALETCGADVAVASVKDIEARLPGGSPTTTVPGLALAGKPDSSGDVPDAIFVRGIPRGTLERVCLRMEYLHFLALKGVAVVNPPRTIEITVNKAMTSLLLAAADVPVPQTFCSEALPGARRFALELLAASARVVCKPLFGSQGVGLRLIETAADVSGLAAPHGVYYLQEFVGPRRPPYRDWRLFWIDGEVVAAMERRSEHWITNRAQGAQCRRLEITAELRDLAAAAAAVVGADYLGIDVLPGPDGPVVTELNGIPAWQGLAAVTSIDVAALLAQRTMQAIAERGTLRPPGRVSAAS